MDEFGESVSIYIWPSGEGDGWVHPEDMWERIREGLASVGFEYEPC